MNYYNWEFVQQAMKEWGYANPEEQQAGKLAFLKREVNNYCLLVEEVCGGNVDRDKILSEWIEFNVGNVDEWLKE